MLLKCIEIFNSCRNSAYLNISHIFCSARFIYVFKFRLTGLICLFQLILSIFSLLTLSVLHVSSEAEFEDLKSVDLDSVHHTSLHALLVYKIIIVVISATNIPLYN